MSRHSTLITLSLCLGALALFWLFHVVAFDALWPRLLDIGPAAWSAAVVGLFGSYALRALRLRFEWAGRCDHGFGECLRITLLHNASVNIMPMRTGELSYAYMLHKRWQVGLADAAASLLWLRLQDACVLGVLGVALLLPAPLSWRAALSLLLLAAGALLGPPLLRRLRAVHAGRTALQPPGAGRVQAFLARATTAALRARGGAAGWLCSAANWLLKLVVYGGLLTLIAHLPPLAALAGALGGELAAVLPVQGPAGLGTYEAGVWAGVQSQAPGAFDNASLLGAALAVHALGVVVALGAGLLALTRRAPSLVHTPGPSP
jgi:Lysylphosphatidylglycerol synthase TM region